MLACCVSCVGPASTTSKYLGKAGHTAAEALSHLETARLSVESSLRGRMLHPYLETTLSEAEDSFSSVQRTFDSIQPPESEQADKVRDKLDQVLTDGADGLAQLRIAVRRNDIRQLSATNASLEDVVKRLNSLSEDPSA
jgi:hypothetical protein